MILHHTQTLALSDPAIRELLRSLKSQLRHLAELIRNPSTPQRPPPSVGVITSPTNTLGTLFARSRTPGDRRPLQVSLTTKSNPATPYATRALQQRRATPGRSRRKSGRMQRETPRDTLRNLSKSRFTAHLSCIELIAKELSSSDEHPTISCIAI